MHLELVVSPHSLPALRAALEDAGARPASRRQLVTNTYYEVPRLNLRRQGLSFCVHKRGAQRVQVLAEFGRNPTNDASGGGASRGEWRDRIRGDAPDLTAPQTGPRLQALDGDGLRPLFAAKVRRTTLTATLAPAVEIVATLDDGEILAPDDAGAAPDCRLTLDLRHGDPAPVYDLALRLLDASPLRLAAQSRIERGYQLAGSAPEAATAEPPVLEPSMTVETVLQRIGRECLSHLLRNEPAALAGEPEAYHQMRVAVRRLRAVLSAMRPLLPAAPYPDLQDALKWLAASVEPARDWDVFARDLLAPVQSVLPADPALEALAAAAGERQHAAYDAARAAIGSRRYTEAMLKILRWVEACGWRDQPVSQHSALLFSPIAEVAPALIERRWRQARTRSKHFARLSQTERHRLRIALKNLRYMVEFFRGLFDVAAAKALTKRLKGLQDDLGHVNDVRTARQLLGELSLPADHRGGDIRHAAGLVIGWYLRELTEMETRLRAEVRRFRKAKPFWPAVDADALFPPP